jgi:hypothetical protein
LFLEVVNNITVKRIKIAMRNKKFIEAFFYLVVEMFQNIIERLERVIRLLSIEFEKNM